MAELIGYLLIMPMATVLIRLSDFIGDKSKEGCYMDRQSEDRAKDGQCHGVTGGDWYTDYLNYDCVDCKFFTWPTKKGGGEEDGH